MTIKEFTKLAKERGKAKRELHDSIEQLESLRYLLKNPTSFMNVNKKVFLKLPMTPNTRIIFSLKIFDKEKQFEYPYKQINLAIIEVKKIIKELNNKLNEIDNKILQYNK